MPLLDAALAFGLTMLVVATVVTAIIRVIRAGASRRREQLLKFLEAFYREELEATVRTQLRRLGDKLTDGAEDQLVDQARQLRERMQRYPGLPKMAGVDAGQLEINEVEAHKLVSVGTAEMIERLRRSELGLSLVGELKEGADSVFAKLAERYEALGERVSESFRASARKWSTAVALVLAFVLNIDSVHILSRYIRDDEIRAKVLAQYDAVLERYEQQVQGSEQAGDGDLQELIAETKAEIENLRGSGFPIGWTRFPYCGEEDADGRCALVQPKARVSAWVFWFFGCLLTGVLAGLGAPFWWDLISGIAKAAVAFRSRRDSGPGVDEKSA